MSSDCSIFYVRGMLYNSALHYGTVIIMHYVQWICVFWLKYNRYHYIKQFSSIFGRNEFMIYLIKILTNLLFNVQHVHKCLTHDANSKKDFIHFLTGFLGDLMKFTSLPVFHPLRNISSFFAIISVLHWKSP